MLITDNSQMIVVSVEKHKNYSQSYARQQALGKSRFE